MSQERFTLPLDVLSAVLDVLSAVWIPATSWVLSAVNDRHLVLKTLDMAIRRRCPGAGRCSPLLLWQLTAGGGEGYPGEMGPGDVKRMWSARAMVFSRRIGLLALSATLATALACGAGATYVLPVSGVEADAYYPAIMTAAQERGAEAHAFDDHVQIRLQEGGWVFFFGGPQRPAMQMIVKVPDDKPAEVPTRTQAGKDFGDAIWKRALELRRAINPG